MKYESPLVRRTQVCAEGGFMTAMASNQPAELPVEETTVEVEEYDDVFNDVTFE